MDINRRGFIRLLGVGVGSLVLAQCAPITRRAKAADLSRLAAAWLRLEELTHPGDYSTPVTDLQRHRDEIIAAHRGVLREMLQSGVVEQAVADELDVVYAEAACWLFRSANFVLIFGTCYTATPSNRPTPLPQAVQADVVTGFGYEASDDLRRRAAVLQTAEGSSDADITVTGQVRQAIERDMEFLAAAGAAAPTLFESYATYGFNETEAADIINRLHTAIADPYARPAFEDLAFEISPGTQKAAAFLISVFQGTL